MTTKATYLQPTRDELIQTLNFVARWVERGCFDKRVSAKDVLDIIAQHPCMPFNEGRWDVDHEPYAKAFYEAHPKAKAVS